MRQRGQLGSEGDGGVQGFTRFGDAIGEAERDVRPGTAINATIVLARRDNVLRVPTAALTFTPPGTINTGLFTSNRNRQPEYAPSVPREEAPTLTYDEMLRRMNASGNPRRAVQPEEVAEYVVEGILNDTFWIMPGERHADISDNFDAIVRARADSIVR